MSPPSERTWVVDTYYVRPVIDPMTQEPAYGANGQEIVEWVPDPNALPAALLEINALMTRIGGVVQMAARRREIFEGRVETIAVVFRWRSFVPLDRSQEAPPIEQDGTEAQAAAPPPPPVPDLPLEDDPIMAPAEPAEPPPVAA